MRSFFLAGVVSSCMIFKENGLSWDEEKNGISKGNYYTYLRGEAAKDFQKVNGKKPKNYRPFVRGDIIPILGFYREGAKFAKRTGDLVVLNGDMNLPNQKYNKVRFLVNEIKNILENREKMSQLTVLDNDLVCPEGTWKVSNQTTQMSQCLDVNECDWTIRSTLQDVGAYRCHKFANCDNLENGEGYACSCREGFVDKSPEGQEGTVCEDIDECETGTHDCDFDPDFECVNGNGYFTCQCAEGKGERSYDEDNNMYCDRFTFFNSPCKQGYILSTKIYECVTDWWSGKSYEECKEEALGYFDDQGRYNITRMECFMSMFPFGCSDDSKVDRHTGMIPDYQISEVCSEDILRGDFRPGGYRDDYVIDFADQTTYRPPFFKREVTQPPTDPPMIFTGSVPVWNITRPANWNLTSPEPTPTTTTTEEPFVPPKGGGRLPFNPGRG